MRHIVRPVTFCIALAVLIGGAVVGLAPAPSAQEAAKPRGNGDVVLVRCNAAGNDLAVSAVQGSPGTPSRKPGGCAENLSYLLKEGFSVRDVGHYHEANFVLYTLVR